LHKNAIKAAVTRGVGKQSAIANVSFRGSPSEVPRLSGRNISGTFSFKPEKPLPGKRIHFGITATFPNEADAKKFARAIMVETSNVTAGTFNPHNPKRTVSTTQIRDWL
jgi:hypothetical protein